MITNYYVLDGKEKTTYISMLSMFTKQSATCKVTMYYRNVRYHKSKVGLFYYHHIQYLFLEILH